MITVFTNGCFDILHIGHVKYLEAANNLGDVLIVGINSDKSIKLIKGDKRPIIPQNERLYIIGALRCVDCVMPFDDPTPIKLIETIRPDILVKGADWNIDDIVGKEFVKSYGGKVVTIPFESDTSTTKIIEKIKNL
jgi:rfaE bifunctional protein nucleotidyltransferase chain/domain